MFCLKNKKKGNQLWFPFFLITQLPTIHVSIRLKLNSFFYQTILVFPAAEKELRLLEFNFPKDFLSPNFEAKEFKK